jgi:hypothetical protein
VLVVHVAGREASRIVAALVAESYPKTQIAAWLGHRWPVLHWRRGAGVTVRTLLRLRAIQRGSWQIMSSHGTPAAMRFSRGLRLTGV